MKPTWTPQQRRAIETVDRSALVSAAAGSGKTAVLAERCAYLICDAPPPQRCGVDGLLVVTFTEAAAAEMRSRIHQTLQARLEQSPHNGYLRAQLALLDTAQISTIHAFCLWMLRRWFSEVGIDPAAAILDEDEARLLKAEIIEALFRSLYETDSPAARRFRDLVDDYALGRDQMVAERVLSLYDFITSLPPTDDWTARVRAGTLEGEPIIVAAARDLICELQRQELHCRALSETIGSCLPEGAFYADLLQEHTARLEAWHATLREAGDACVADDVYERVRSAIADWTRSARGAPRVNGDEPKARRDAAKALFDEAREHFTGRIQQRFGRFTRAQMRAGLAQVAPHVEGLLDLVIAFQQRYQAAKRVLDVLDFSDLERYAFELLHGSNGVAAELRSRFAQVLVDEFQDVNPLQHSILYAVSREPDPEPANNLFAVGDVKQSIYRFRLAEPTIFLNRMRAFASEGAGGASIALQANFRSQEAILKGVNLIFRGLMRRSAGLIEYDASAELCCGAPERQQLCPLPITLHLLERKIESDGEPEDDSTDEGDRRAFDSPWNEPASWESIEREAYLIGTEIRNLVGAETLIDGRPIRYRDIAILLRSAAHRAGPMAAVLAHMGIPAYTSAGQTLFDTIEIQDVLSLLRVLDNAQQDIPLAAVLSSGVTGASLTPDDLVTLRCFDREAPFHAAVRRFARLGPAGDLKERLMGILNWLDRYRERIRRRPLADVLWAIYSETGYLAHATGLENGLQRRANLLYLHERARQFGTFQRQGLHRFLRFIESLQHEGREIGAAPAIGEGEDVVRILTIHQSKGLEYPVVFVADVGKAFNLEDMRGRIIFDRQAGIGLKVVDREKMIEYPTVAHRRVAEQIASAARDEELRVLYVALTRGRERLILVGSAHVNSLLERYAPSAAWSGRSLRTSVTDIDIVTARSPLEWILAALAHAPAGTVQWSAAPCRSRKDVNPLFEVRTHPTDEISTWNLRPVESEAAQSTRRAVARLERLPPHEALAADASQVDEIIARLKFEYPYLPAASVRAVRSASEAKRAYDYTVDLDEFDRRTIDRTRAERQSEIINRKSREEARVRGTATHRVLQHIDLLRVGSAAAIREQIELFTRDGRLSPAEAAVVDAEAIEWFFGTPLGKRICDAGSSYAREFMFLCAEPASFFDRTLGGSVDDPVLVRGVIDGVLVNGRGVEILDFKTDCVAGAQIAQRAAEYALQMRLYADAAARHWRLPVEKCHLVFLHARQIVHGNPAIPTPG